MKMAKDEEEKEKPSKKRTKRYEITEIPVETGLVIKDNETEEQFDTLRMLCNIANDVADIKKNLG